MTTFVLFIKEPNTAERMYGFHLGTVEGEARKIVEERWAFRTQPTNTLPQYEYLRLEFGGKPFAVYDGVWDDRTSNERLAKAMNDSGAFKPFVCITKK